MLKKRCSCMPTDYCDRLFKDEATLVQHQKAAHFKCPGALLVAFVHVHLCRKLFSISMCIHCTKLTMPAASSLQNATASSTHPRAWPRTATKCTRSASRREWTGWPSAYEVTGRYGLVGLSHAEPLLPLCKTSAAVCPSPSLGESPWTLRFLGWLVCQRA